MKLLRIQKFFFNVFVFKIMSAEMSATCKRGPWEAAANVEGSRLGYSDEWTRSTRMNNATFKAFHAGNSIDFDRKHKGKRHIDVPPPVIYLANEGFRFQDAVVDGGGPAFADTLLQATHRANGPV